MGLTSGLGGTRATCVHGEGEPRMAGPGRTGGRARLWASRAGRCELGRASGWAGRVGFASLRRGGVGGLWAGRAPVSSCSRGPRRFVSEGRVRPRSLPVPVGVQDLRDGVNVIC